MKQRKPLVDSRFTVLVVPSSYIVPRVSLTIPQVVTMRPGSPVCAEASGEEECGVSWWSMKSPVKVVRALRRLADYLEKIDREESGKP